MNVFIFTQGCSANQADSEAMAGILLKDGHQVVNSPQDADVLVLNTCTVKSPTEMKAFSILKRWKGSWPRKGIVVAGCIAQSDPSRLSGYTLLGTRQIHRITEAVAAAARGETACYIAMDKEKRLEIPHLRKNPVVEIVPINAGCLGSCSYCKTRQARGGLLSYPMHDIIKRIESAVREGVKEIWLTSQDTGAYGRDIRQNLPSLLRAVVAVEGDFMVRVGMMNPNHVMEFFPDLLDVMRHSKMYAFLHIPLQSGSDKVLGEMRRQYRASDVEALIATARREIPGITIASDVIVGFPGESEEDFQKTCQFLGRLRIPILNVSKFYPRPGTLAARMQKLPTKVVKERCARIVHLQRKHISNMEWIGWEGMVLVDETKDGSFIGRTSSYRQVVIQDVCDLGEMVRVRVTGVTPIDLRAVRSVHMIGLPIRPVNYS